MLELDYSIVIEDPSFFGFYSPDLPGFSGIGHSIEDCLYKARHGLREHLETLREQGLPIPPASADPRVTIQNEKASAA